MIILDIVNRMDIAMINSMENNILWIIEYATNHLMTISMTFK